VQHLLDLEIIRSTIYLMIHETYDLSICIPTYNRAEFLDLCLERLISQLHDLKIRCEVLVVDNASTDHTGLIVQKHQKMFSGLNYFVRKKTVDITAQWRNTLLRASGRWVVYLADDDRIDASVVAEHIKEFSVNDVGAIYCDWFAWDDKNDKLLHNYFTVDRSYIFNPDLDNTRLLNFVLQNHVIPESGIYSREILRNALTVAPASGFFYNLLALMFLQAGVAFGAKPYYFENRVLKEHLVRNEWANHDLSDNQVDDIRGGLENLALHLLRENRLDSQNRLILHDAITKFASRRAAVLRNRCLAAKNWQKAFYIEQRIRLWNPVDYRLTMEGNSAKARVGYQDLITIACIAAVFESADANEVVSICVSSALVKNFTSVSVAMNFSISLEILDLERPVGSNNFLVFKDATEQAQAALAPDFPHQVVFSHLLKAFAGVKG